MSIQRAARLTSGPRALDPASWPNLARPSLRRDQVQRQLLRPAEQLESGRDPPLGPPEGLHPEGHSCLVSATLDVFFGFVRKTPTNDRKQSHVSHEPEQQPQRDRKEEALRRRRAPGSPVPSLYTHARARPRTQPRGLGNALRGEAPGLQQAHVLVQESFNAQGPDVRKR